MRKFIVAPGLTNIWKDQLSGITFDYKKGIIEVPENTPMININRYIRFNYILEIIADNKDTNKSIEIDAITPNKLLKLQEEQDNKIKLELDSKDKCPYCNKLISKKGYHNHMKFCKKKPKNNEEEA